MKEDIMPVDYSTVTELAGDEITQEQLERLCHRYYWAGSYCKDKDVLEAACGTGPGLGYISGLANSLIAGDYDNGILEIARRHYGGRIDLCQFDAQNTPFEDNSFDVVILFEAIYYLPSAKSFVKECKRVLRDGGFVLIATANKDLYDFNPSPYSHAYYGTVELDDLFADQGFAVECFGYLSVRDVSMRQRVLRPIKKLAVELGLMPKSTRGKKWLKRVVFGHMTTMPAEIDAGMAPYTPPVPVSVTEPDREHKVVYCAARLSK